MNETIELLEKIVRLLKQNRRVWLVWKDTGWVVL